MSYQRGLVEVADGVHAYLQPDGSWGWSNAGLVEKDGASILVDTLFDRVLTREMLAAMRARTPAAQKIGTVVNTHANGDHCWGNQEVPGARIVSSRASAEEMVDLPPSRVALMVKAARLAVASGPLARVSASLLRAVGLTPLADLLEAAPFVERIFRPFHFDGITLVPPDTTFDGTLRLEVAGRAVELMEVGPAHTRGDVMAYVPDAGVLFTGDILFVDGHPVVWAGPVSRWVAALDRVLALKPRVIVPGHGPMTDLHGVERLRAYLVHVDTEARKRHAAGMDAYTAARDISLDGFRGWSDAERIAINVEAVYRELNGETGRMNVVKMFARMGRVAAAVK